MDKWYKYQDRIINLSVFDNLKLTEVMISGKPTYEIIFCLNGQTKDWFKYSSLEEAQQELEKIYNILSK